MKEKCGHPEDSVRTISGKHEPWQGTCEKCGAEVRMIPVKYNPIETASKDEK